jgi:hypothetical protein
MGVQSLEPGCVVSSERVERRLAAVLAADVAGYSRLMGRDEEGTLAQLKSFRKALVDPAIAEHRGRIVKTSGDGMLIEFASAVDAARCAVDIQRRMATQNTDVPQHQRIEFRIGIHLGDIIIDDNDIFGDGVNIAARLEGIGSRAASASPTTRGATVAVISLARAYVESMLGSELRLGDPAAWTTNRYRPAICSGAATVRSLQNLVAQLQTKGGSLGVDAADFWKRA